MTETPIISLPFMCEITETMPYQDTIIPTATFTDEIIYKLWKDRQEELDIIRYQEKLFMESEDLY